MFNATVWELSIIENVLLRLKIKFLFGQFTVDDDTENKKISF